MLARDLLMWTGNRSDRTFQIQPDQDGLQCGHADGRIGETTSVFAHGVEKCGHVVPTILPSSIGVNVSMWGVRLGSGLLISRLLGLVGWLAGQWSKCRYGGRICCCRLRNVGWTCDGIMIMMWSMVLDWWWRKWGRSVLGVWPWGGREGVAGIVLRPEVLPRAFFLLSGGCFTTASCKW